MVTASRVKYSNIYELQCKAVSFCLYDRKGLRFAKATIAEQGEAIFPEAQFYGRIRSFCSGNEKD